MRSSFFPIVFLVLGSISLLAGPGSHDAGSKTDSTSESDAKAYQLFQCLDGIRKAGGLPEGIEIRAANAGAVHFCGLIVSRDGFYKYELSRLRSDSEVGFSQLGWLIEKRDYQLTLPNSKKKVRLAKLGGFEQFGRAVVVLPFCDGKDEDLPQLPLTKLTSADPELERLSSCVKSALTNGTSQRIRALINALNEKSDSASAKTGSRKKEYRAELRRLGWPDNLKVNVEAWVQPCGSLLSDSDKKEFFGDAEIPGGYIGATKELKLTPLHR